MRTDVYPYPSELSGELDFYGVTYNPESLCDTQNKILMTLNSLSDNQNKILSKLNVLEADVQKLASRLESLEQKSQNVLLMVKQCHICG
jgi:hypothetical protein